MVAVDSSVITHLARVGKLDLLKSYFKKIRVAEGIEKEIISEGKPGAEGIKKGLGEWIEVRKTDAFGVNDILGAADIELIKLAEKEGDFILTNDEKIISYAKAMGIETMWPTTFLVLCLKKKLIAKKEAKQILDDLVKYGCYLRTDTYAAVLKLIEEA